MHFDVVLSVFIHPFTQKRRRAQYSRGVDAAVCVRALQMCVRVRRKLLTQRATVTQSRASSMLTLCLRAVLISSPDM